MMNSNNVIKQCIGVDIQTGNRCAATIGLDINNYCFTHRVILARHEREQCRYAPFNGQRCMNRVKSNYHYCRSAHDPTIVYIPPRIFNDTNIHTTKLQTKLLNKSGLRDIYHKDLIDPRLRHLYNIDHIMEKQCFTYILTAFKPTDTMYLINIINANNIVNNLNNLCVTRAITNQLKGAAVNAFIDDLLTGHKGSLNLIDYLMREELDGQRISIRLAYNIVNEMSKAFKYCDYLLNLQNDPLLQAMTTRLRNLVAEMGLPEMRTLSANAPAFVPKS